MFLAVEWSDNPNPFLEMSGSSNHSNPEYKVGKRCRSDRVNVLQQKSYSEQNETTETQISKQERKVLGRLNGNSYRPLPPSASTTSDHRNRRSSSTSSSSSCSSFAYSSSGSSQTLASTDDPRSRTLLGTVNCLPMKRIGGCHGLVFIVADTVLQSVEKEIALDLEPRICAAVRLLNQGLPVFLLNESYACLRAGFELARQQRVCHTRPRIYINRTCVLEPITREKFGHVFDPSRATVTVTLNQFQVEELARIFRVTRPGSKGPTAIELESDGLSSTSESTSVSSWASIVKNKPEAVYQHPLSTPLSEFSVNGFSDDSSVNTVDAEMMMQNPRTRGYSSELEGVGNSDAIATDIIHAAVTEFVRYVDASISGFGPALSPEDCATVGYSGSDAFQLFTSIQSLIGAIFPQACVEIYGSLSTGLWLPGQSDLDLFINLQQYRIPPNSMLHHAPPPPPPPPVPMNPLLYNGPQGLRDFAMMQERIRINNYYQSWARFKNQLLLQGGDIEIVSLSREELLAHLSTLQNALKVQPWCQSTKLIARAEMPVVKLIAAPVPVPGLNTHKSAIPVDISILTGEHKGLQARDYVSLVVSEYPTLLRPLILAVKRILRERELHDTYTGGLGSYSLTIMAAFFLQKCGFVFKSVRVTRQAGDDVDPEIQNAELIIASVVKGLDIATSNIGDLLLRFLQLFSPHQVGGLDLSKVGISLSDGMFRHHQPASLCIRDPTNAEHYIGAGSFAMSKVQSLFAEVRSKLRENPSTIYNVLNWKAARGAATEPLQPVRAPVVAEMEKTICEETASDLDSVDEAVPSRSAAVGLIKLPLLKSPPDSSSLAETPAKQLCGVGVACGSMPPALNIKMPTGVSENKRLSFTEEEHNVAPEVVSTPQKPVSWAQVASSTGSRSHTSASPRPSEWLTPISDTNRRTLPVKKLSSGKKSSSRRSQRLFVGNIAYGAKESDIQWLLSEFKTFGKVKEVNLNLEAGKLWICYKDEKDAAVAIERMNRKVFLNRELYVEFSFKMRNKAK